MSIDYNHQNNLHTQEGARSALPILFPDWKPNSLLDVGCGTGTWLKAAYDFGISNVFGIDGIAIPPEQLLVSETMFQQQDLTLPWDLGKRFDVVLCLEVAEHLEAKFAKNLIQTITNHTDTVVFSAASPYQPGQHHVNCQWPAYWQAIFNKVGFVCSDEVRWQMWNTPQIEVWYRQNMFIARHDPTIAGKEERIKPVIHPELMCFVEPDITTAARLEFIQQIEHGAMSADWYLKTPFKAIHAKTKRCL